VTEPPPAQPDGGSNPFTAIAQKLSDNPGAALVGGITLVSAVLVGLGIEGELVGRLLRNHPELTALFVGLTVVAVATPLLASVAPRTFRPTLMLVSPVLLVVGSCGLVWTAVSSTGMREQPGLDVTTVASDTEAGTVTLEVTATGLSLASDHRMLLRIAAFSDALTLDRANDVCADTSSPDRLSVQDADGAIVWWAESGPDLKGEAQTSGHVTLETGRWRWACALAVYNTSSPEDVRRVVAVVDLAAAGVPLPAAPTPTSAQPD
jgi:hypothetical protein